MLRHTPRRNMEELCGLLNIDRPVLLAPMAGVAGGALASAVSRSGGLGFVGGGYGDIGSLDRQMALAEGARVGVGLINWAMAPGALDAALHYQLPAVWLSFGDSSPYVAAVRDSGALLVCQVFTVADAVAMAEAGADVIVVQGTEAGGHGRPVAKLGDLIRSVSNALPNTPLVAAGGMNDASDLKWATGLGAWGVAVGTAYSATIEALENEGSKERLVAAQSRDTVRGVVYDLLRGPEWPQGFTARSLRSSLTDRWTGNEGDLARSRSAEADRYCRMLEAGDDSVRVVWAGEGVGKITSIPPAAEVTERFPICR
jgi:nitronate monooxygenase